MRRGRGVAALLLVLGCAGEGRPSASEAAAELGLPTPVPAEVRLIAERDGYLDVAVDTRRSDLRFFFPASDACRAVVGGAGEASYSSQGGPYGRLRRGDASCDPVGLLALPAWQQRRPRQTTRGGSPVPRATADYRIVYTDEDVLFARGRFPLASKVGWAGGWDTLAIFPNTPECEGLLDKRHASMEYRDAGKQPLVLLDAGQLCPFLGFAMPNT